MLNIEKHRKALPWPLRVIASYDLQCKSPRKDIVQRYEPRQMFERALLMQTQIFIYNSKGCLLFTPEY